MADGTLYSLTTTVLLARSVQKAQDLAVMLRHISPGCGSAKLGLSRAQAGVLDVIDPDRSRLNSARVIACASRVIAQLVLPLGEEIACDRIAHERRVCK